MRSDGMGWDGMGCRVESGAGVGSIRCKVLDVEWVALIFHVICSGLCEIWTDSSRILGRNCECEGNPNFSGEGETRLIAMRDSFLGVSLGFVGERYLEITGGILSDGFYFYFLQKWNHGSLSFLLDWRFLWQVFGFC
jgi:hypothetical protein